MISDVKNFPFNFLFDKKVRDELSIVVINRCESKKIANDGYYIQVMDHLEMYLNTNFNIVSYFTKDDPFGVNNFILSLFFDKHPILNESSYKTLMKLIDDFIDNNPKYAKELLKYYSELIDQALCLKMTSLKDEFLESYQNHPIKELLDFTSNQVLDLSLDNSSNDHIVRFYNSLNCFLTTQHLINPNGSSRKSSEVKSFIDVLKPKYKDWGEDILSILNDTTPSIVDEHNHWVGELQAAYVFHETLKAEKVIECSLEDFKKIIYLKFKGFNPNGVKKPNASSKAYDYKVYFIERLNFIKGKK